MKLTHTVIIVALLMILPGCSKTDSSKSRTPREPTAEEAEFQKQMSQYTHQIKTALSQPGDYVQIAIVDRHATFPEMEETPVEYTRVLVLHREVLDLDDYGFSLPGKEESAAEEHYVPGFFNDTLFFVDQDANIFFEDGPQPPGTEMVVEWCVPNSAGDQVSLHFGGNPCLTIDLSE